MAASQAKRSREALGEQANEMKGAAAAAQARDPCGLDVGQAKQPSGGTAAVTRESMPSDAAVGGSLSRSERVRKTKILADM